MTAEDISRIVVTVAVCQLCCDLLAYWRVYNTESYDRVTSAYSRAKWKKEKATKDAVDQGVDPNNPSASTTVTSAKTGKQKSNNKVARAAQALERATQDCHDAAANVARKHMMPNMLTSLLFVILMRILGTEYKGQIMGILPFTPWGFFKRITARGLEFGELAFESDVPEKVSTTDQAISFVFVYMLSALSVKFYTNQLFGTSPPTGADGMMGVTQSTWGKSVLRQMGMDPDDLKME